MEALAKLGIDGWGILLYLVNFGVLLALLQRFVYKPLVQFLDDRRNQIKQNIEEADALRAQLEADQQTELAERQERERVLQERISEAKRVVKEDAKQVLMSAEAQRDTMLSEAGLQADRMIAEALTGAEQETVSRIQRVVMHVLRDSVSEEVVHASVQESWKRVTTPTTYGK